MLFGPLGFMRSLVLFYIQKKRLNNYLINIGKSLLEYLLGINQSTCLLVGTWKDATWAIKFYKKFGFVLHTKEKTKQLLKKYWRIPSKQIENSVVLER